MINSVNLSLKINNLNTLLNKKLYHFFLYVSLYSILVCFPDSILAQTAKTRQRLIHYNQSNLNEQVYLHTDCEVYAPGDTIWFRAYIRNKYLLEKSDLSKVFHLNLVNESGNILVHEKFLVFDSQSPGFIVLANTLPDGYYSLVYYTSWMENFDVSETGRKKILIIRDVKKGIRLIPQFDKTSYSPGDTIRLRVKYLDDLNREMKGSRFRYRMSAGPELIGKGAVHSDVTASDPLEFIVPEESIEKPRLELWDGDQHAAFEVPLNRDIHIDFFPEGGKCLQNVMGNMAFKAVHSNGIPARISGIIVDEEGNEMDSVNCEHDGMGRFFYYPEKGRKFFIKTAVNDGSSLMPLPDGVENEMTIHANVNNKKLYVNVLSNKPAFDTCLVLLSIRGYIHYYKWIQSQDGVTYTPPLETYPAGIGVLTLLDKHWIPQAERLIFINHPTIEVPGLSTDHGTYRCRDSVVLRVDLGDSRIPFQNGQYSLSVFDAEFGSSRILNEADIVSSSYLLPEIRGKINNPNYYFLNDDPETRYHLDLLLLTQGWRTYRYKEFFTEADSLYPVNRDLIHGVVKRFRFGREPIGEKSALSIYFAGNWTEAHTNEDGSFSFFPEYSPAHLSPVIVTAKYDKGSKNAIIELEEDTFHEALKNYLSGLPDSSETVLSGETFVFEDIKRELNMNASNSIWLEEVEVRRRIRKDTIDVEEQLVKNMFNVRQANEGNFAAATDITEIVNSMGFLTQIDEENDNLLVFYQGNYAAVRFIVDGFDMGETYSTINSFYMPSDIEKLYVARGFDVQLLYNSGAVMYITTRGPGSYANESSSDKNFIIIPILKVNKEYYSPAYPTEQDRQFPVPDIRKTIYWNPDVKLDENGKARLVFYNSDRYTHVNCILEGITDEGLPVHKETSYDISIYRE